MSLPISAGSRTSRSRPLRPLHPWSKWRGFSSLRRVPQATLLLTLSGCVLFSAVLAFTALGTRPLVSPGEARYALIAREMLESGDWIQPRLNRVRYYEKPPLLYWCVGIAYRLFGQNEMASRLPSAAAYVATVAVTFFLARELLGGSAAPLAAFIFATLPGPFLFGRFLSTVFFIDPSTTGPRPLPRFGKRHTSVLGSVCSGAFHWRSWPKGWRARVPPGAAAHLLVQHQSRNLWLHGSSRALHHSIVARYLRTLASSSRRPRLRLPPLLCRERARAALLQRPGAARLRVALGRRVLAGHRSLVSPVVALPPGRPGLGGPSESSRHPAGMVGLGRLVLHRECRTARALFPSDVSGPGRRPSACWGR